MISVLFLNVIIALSAILTFLIAALLYVTPGLGYDHDRGVIVIRLFSYMIADTDPHFGFLLTVVFGFLSLSLCMQEKESTGGNIMVLTTLICLLGFINFDVKSHLLLHNAFVVGFSVAVSAFCLYALHWNTSDNNYNIFHQVGVILHCTVSGLLYCVACYRELKYYYYYSTTTTVLQQNICSCLQILWIMATLFVFSVYFNDKSSP